MPEANDIGKLLELVRALNVPDSRPRVLRTIIRRRRPLPRPVVGLIGVPAGSSLLVEIYRWLGESGGRRATPRARVDLSAADLPPDALAPDPNATGEEIEGHCLPILQRLVEGFSTDDTAMGPIRFPRYRTADWLTRQRVTSDETEAAVELRARLPKLLRSGSPASSSAGDASEAAAGDIVSRVVFGVFALWPVLRLWLWISGRIPGMSKVTRWFMHQRYLAPELSDSFLGFATRLTVSGRSDENEEQIAKLLVHAFLEDLRDAYRRPLWRPSGWRRTAYPVALLGPVAPDSAGARLLARINDIRNETGLFDPLVVVACLASPPARPQVRDLGRIGDLTNLDTLESLVDRPSSSQEPDPLQRWLRNIDHMRTNRLPYAWYLPLRVRLPDPLDGRVRDPRYAHLAVPPAPPLAARRGFVAMSVLVPVLLLAAGTLVAVPALYGATCEHWPWTSGISVESHGGECVGYSDNADQVFTDDPDLIAMQREVFRLNAEAEAALRDNPRRPMVSLVYFSGLSYADANVRYPLAQVEELAGLAVQQRLALVKRSESEPLLRVVIANGGTEMSQAPLVVDNHLRTLFAEDPGVLGVVGMDRSSAATRTAITRLGDLGIPVVATTLSANGLAAASPLYFQATPSNDTHARLIADYVAGARYPKSSEKAGQPRFRKVIIYHPKAPDAPVPPDDLYVTTLVAALTGQLKGREIDIEERTWSVQEELNRFPVFCTPDFDRETLLFYAGRNDDFPTFARAVGSGCLSGESPAILGNDTLTRVIADPDVTAALPGNLTVRYVAKAAPAVLGGRECLSGTARVGTAKVPGEYAALCGAVPGLIADLRGYPGVDWPAAGPPWVGDRLGLGYDVAGLFLETVRVAERIDRVPSRSAVALQLRDTAVHGVTGYIDFTSGRVAETSSLAVLVTDAVGKQGPHRCLVMFPGAATGKNTGTGDEPAGGGNAAGGESVDGCPSGTGKHADAAGGAGDPADKDSELEDWVRPAPVRTGN
ncbi:hypothetical protein [Nocardia higoensis]|uniref:hypothetical protein n=1 Tax=Nocardia higoensis TaxID=228599 RepID=UPI0002FC2E65|nr:hypothetical protein [Nocardia higoensis]